MTTIGKNIERQRQAANSWQFRTVPRDFRPWRDLWLSAVATICFSILSAELFSISVAWAVFFLVWNTREMMEKDALVFVGTSYFFIGFIDLLHTLAYKGMGVFGAHWGANLPTQLWILARYLESGSLLLYPMLIGKTFRPGRVFFSWLGITAAVLVSIFYRPVFPGLLYRWDRTDRLQNRQRIHHLPSAVPGLCPPVFKTRPSRFHRLSADIGVDRRHHLRRTGVHFLCQRSTAFPIWSAIF